jgi:hypothetical protein
VDAALDGKMSDDNRTSGMGLWTDANEMLRAAKHLMTVKQLALSQPLYFLLGHALELAFKSYIRAKGASLNSLRSVGHDLVVAKEWAITAGIEELARLDEQEHLAIKMLNEYYRRKEFEYRVTGGKSYPEAKLLAELIEKLLNGTHDVCLKSV